MNRSFLLVSAMSVCLLTSCADLTEQIGDFDKAVTKTTTSVSTLYLKVDKFRRNTDLAMYKYKPFEQIQATDANGDPTSISNRYDEKYIKVRVQAVQALGDYADELAKLAGSDAPKKAGAEIQAIGDKVGDISKNISSLSSNPKLDASKYTGPIANLAAVCTQMYLEYKQKKMITQSILEARKPVHETCDLLKTDIAHIYQNDYIVPVNDCRNAAIRYWNANGSSLSNSDKAALLADIRDFSDKYFDLKRSSPSDAVQSMEDMFDELADQVDKKKPKKEQVAKAAVNLRHFEAVADRAVTQTNKL